MALSKEQFMKLRSQGITPEQIATFETRRMQESGTKPLLQRGVEAVMETPKRIAPALPIAGSIAGGAAVPGIAKGIGLGILGRGAGEQLKSEMQESPLRGLARIVEPALPGVTGLTKAVSPDVSQKAMIETVKKVPEEIAFGAVGGMIGQVLRGFRPLGKKATLKAAREVASELQGIRGEMGRDIAKIVDDFPDQAIDIKKTNQALKELPSRAVKFIRQNPKLYDVKFLPNGSPVSTLRNLQNLKEAIADFVTSPKQWDESTKAQIGAIKGVYGKIRDIMVEAQPRLQEPLKAYHNFMNEVYDYVKPIVKSASGQIKEKPLRGALKPGAELARQESLEKLAKLSNTAKDAISVVKTFNKREALRQAGKRILPYGLLATGTAGGAYGISKMLE